MKLFGVMTLLIIALAVPLRFARAGTVYGRVIDAATQAGIPGVTVTARQRGWGWDHYLVWDKDYYYTAVTDQAGAFTLVYGHGSSANLVFAKPGYSLTKDRDIWLGSGQSGVIEMMRD